MLVASGASAADLGGYYGGSVKDVPVPEYAYAAPSGNCYVRADVGYSGSVDPSVKWPVLTHVDADGDGYGDDATVVYGGDNVSGVSIEDSWLVEGGVGCKFGASKGIRIEAALGYRGERKIEGEPIPYIPPPADPHGPGIEDDPLHTAITSYTLMFNAYKDLGTYGRFTPYVGAGIGVAYHTMDSPYFTQADGVTQHPHFPERIAGNSDLSFAWALMAGVGYSLSERTTIDLGYRYIDLGEIESQGVTQSGGGAYPEVRVEDIRAHEVKLGLRYSFGGGDCCGGPAYPMK